MLGIVCFLSVVTGNIFPDRLQHFLYIPIHHDSSELVINNPKLILNLVYMYLYIIVLRSICFHSEPPALKEYKKKKVCSPDNESK